jgi:hypothetical protein
VTRADARRLKLTRSLEEAHALADAVLSRARAHSRRVAPKRAASVEAKAQSRMDRAQRTFEVREACAKRAGGKCETCGNEATEEFPLQMHHLLPGRGRRQQQQAPENCVMVCMWCHEFGHGGRIMYVGPGLLAWADRYGYREARDNIRRRMDKALIADPTWPRDADEVARLGPGEGPNNV